MVWSIMEGKNWRVHLRRVRDTSQTPRTPCDALGCGSLLGGAYGIEETEELLHPRNLQSIEDALTHSHQCQGSPVLLMSYVGSHQRPDAGGIGVGYAGEVDDQRP